MPRLKLTLEYDGTEFHGWQVQPELRTVQGVVEEKLSILLDEAVKLVGAGRTDAGVHARGQVAHCETCRVLGPEAIRRGINSLLPPDVAVQRVEQVAPDFHARYAALRKTYSYTILRQPSPSPLWRRTALHVRASLNVEAMREAAAALRGRHNFCAFWGGGDDRRTPWRTLTRLEIEEHPPLLRIWMEADSFLRHMVRNVVGTLLEIGRGRYPSDWARQVLESRDRSRAGATAPAHGLCLEEVVYVLPGEAQGSPPQPISASLGWT